MFATTGSSRHPLRGPLYLDASALVKLYVPEPDSDRHTDHCPALAVSGDAKAVLTYDRRMGQAASALGLNVCPETRPPAERRRSP